jgi:hypothetical protein
MAAGVTTTGFLVFGFNHRKLASCGHPAIGAGLAVTTGGMAATGALLSGSTAEYLMALAITAVSTMAVEAGQAVLSIIIKS